jgi:hypothetical protein
MANNRPPYQEDLLYIITTASKGNTWIDYTTVYNELVDEAGEKWVNTAECSTAGYNKEKNKKSAEALRSMYYKMDIKLVSGRVSQAKNSELENRVTKRLEALRELHS